MALYNITTQTVSTTLNSSREDSTVAVYNITTQTVGATSLNSAIIIGAVLGTVVGFLSLSLLLLLLWIVMKDKQACHTCRPRGGGQMTNLDTADRPQRVDSLTYTAVEMKTNAAYTSIALQVSTKDNVAYIGTKSAAQCQDNDNDYVQIF